MSSVLLLLSLGMFTVTQAMISFMHDCIERSSTDNLSGGAVICICRSSANESKSFVLKDDHIYFMQVLDKIFTEVEA